MGSTALCPIKMVSLSILLLGGWLSVVGVIRVVLSQTGSGSVNVKGKRAAA